MLPKSNKGNVQVPVLSFLTIPGVSPLPWAFVTAIIWYPKTCYLSAEFGLTWVWCRQGCSAPQDSPGFSALRFCNRNAISWLHGFGNNNNLQMCEVLYKKGKVWGNDLANASVRNLSLFFVSMPGHVVFIFSTPCASWAGTRSKICFL